MSKPTFWSIACLVLFFQVGCEPPSTQSTPPVSQNSRAPTGKEPVADSSANTAPATIREAAKVGDGKKGHSYGKTIFTKVPAASWRIKEKIVFTIAIPHALDLYKNTNPKFQGPQSHEEFMEKIVEFNNIELPELPDGHRYVYDPEKEQLMIERPVESGSK